MGLLDSLLNRRKDEDVIMEQDTIKEVPTERIVETSVIDNSDSARLIGGTIESIKRKEINEGQTNMSATELSKMLTDDGNNMSAILGHIHSKSNMFDTYYENEAMSKDSIIGAAMEIMADDAVMIDETTGKAVTIESDDPKLKKFIEDFITMNVHIEDRLWTWAFEVVKHGDFKLRRCEYYVGYENSGLKNVYYEDVVNPYAVSRIEYMGDVLGFEDEEVDDFIDPNNTLNNQSFMGNGYGNTATGSTIQGSGTFEKPNKFVHFISGKLSNKEKVRLTVRRNNKQENINCYRVIGTSLMDNARQMFRIMNVIDNMLVMTRIARSTQFNLVKVEVGNASAGQTQQMLSDVRRRFESNMKIKKGSGMRSDPSPLPINSNVYIPTRDGKGDITFESVGDSFDIASIVDIDYFTDKEFASVKVPKTYLGFAESLGSLGNNSLVKMDLRYARSVSRVQQILINGITALIRNYLSYRGRQSDNFNFKVRLRPLPSSESSSRIEDFVTGLQAMDSGFNMTQSFGSYIDNAKLFKYLLGLIDINPTDIANTEFETILKELRDGEYKEENHTAAAAPEEEY